MRNFFGIMLFFSCIFRCPVLKNIRFSSKDNILKSGEAALFHSPAARKNHVTIPGGNVD